MMVPFRRYILAFLVIFSCTAVALPVLAPDTGTVLLAQRSKKKPKAPPKGAAAKKSKGKSASTAKGGKKKKVAATPKRSSRKTAEQKPKTPAIPPRMQIVPDSVSVTELAPGVAHHRIATVSRQIVNVIMVDLKSGARLRSFKAHERYDGLQKASDIATLAKETLRDTVIAATNASFWRAGTNSPIGATITAGEVIEMPGYKLWSSLLIYDDGSAAIDRITLRGELFWRHRHRPVDGVNFRGRNDNGIVVYNHYYGDSLPRGSRKSDSAIIAEAFANKVGAEIGDDTEGEGIDTAAIIRSYREGKLLEDREHPLLKIACVPLKPRSKRLPLPAPRLDDTMRLTVVAIDTGVVAVPENGYVISLGDDAEWFTVLGVGDTVSLLYTISPKQPKPVRDVLTGTPRIVRDGRAAPEHDTEGSKARRFVDGKLSRTAVGISRGGDTLFLATVDSPNSSEETTGMSLIQLAAFMESIGCYQAMNFDGGGSASMAVDGEMISRQGSRPTSRRVSNAMLVVRPFQEKKLPRPRPSTASTRTQP